MGLFKKNGRADIEAWAKALIQGYKKGMPVEHDKKITIQYHSFKDR